MSSNPVAKKVKYALGFLPDEAYMQLYYSVRFHRLCNLKHPRTYNEKLQWLKLHDRNPAYTSMVDKAEAKRIAARVIGEEHIIPTLAIWDDVDDIDLDALPESFVLKCTHDSEGVVVVPDKGRLEWPAVRARLAAGLARNFYPIGREWPYLGVRPRIIAEAYMEDARFGELRDYKFFCFDGEPKAMFVASGRRAGATKFDYFDMDFNRLDIRQCYPNSDGDVERPETFNRMADVARELSKGIPHVRIDFYEVDGRMYFGEYTFYHFSGFMPFDPPEWDEMFGSWLRLPISGGEGR
ncbi:hypothetical protein BN3658_01368 [Coriobacteriaceae bacterium CHKCI002]|nr:hypothetical protein BN3658_01368 [Coriobacteriaceae bacterium CHKCI002]